MPSRWQRHVVEGPVSGADEVKKLGTFLSASSAPCQLKNVLSRRPPLETWRVLITDCSLGCQTTQSEGTDNAASTGRAR